MVLKYHRPSGSRSYKDYSEESLKKAVVAVKSGIFRRKAAVEFGIPRATLNRAVEDKPLNKVGWPCVLSEEEQVRLAECVSLAGDWGFPLNMLDIRLIVKGFLDRSGRNKKRFKNNMPGVEFAMAFVQRYKSKLSNKLCQNVERSRAAVSEEIINSYFDELQGTLDGVDPAMIINYDETNMTDDPGRKKVVVRRGFRHPERIIDFSKSSTSVMFSGSADGIHLPPYITYKAENLYDTWTVSGPKGAFYNRSKSGWFTLEIFEDRFRKVALPYFKKFDKDATKVMIGDNLASHISPWIIEECKSHNIKFLLLPPNSTYYTQPLDVAFFRPLKIKWRQTFNDWKLKNRGCVPKDRFPRLLRQCLEALSEENVKNNLVSGFKATGIVPLDRQQVLKRLPKVTKNDDTNSEKDLNSSNAESDWVETFKSYLGDSRKKETQPTRKMKKKKLNVPAGRGVEGLGEIEAEDSTNDHCNNPQPCTSSA
ncbi:MFS-type transporter clz9-like [Homalodisca vitripennis]|uniref:MFS-type transporter clz9-like n=1 Tax=Homalodisca vitripennis TaxID=197043 RepID=UPI001EEABCDA|nr:MFS-type transporter clz9-like [Homalodisca vitripennis]